jgi:hypothetical protein
MNTRTQNQWPVVIKSGSAVVKIYRTEKANGYVSYTAVYYKGRERGVQHGRDRGNAVHGGAGQRTRDLTSRLNRNE